MNEFITFSAFVGLFLNGFAPLSASGDLHQEIVKSSLGVLVDSSLVPISCGQIPGTTAQVAGLSIGETPDAHRFCSGERLLCGRWIKHPGLSSRPQIHLLSRTPCSFLLQPLYWPQRGAASL